MDKAKMVYDIITMQNCITAARNRLFGNSLKSIIVASAEYKLKREEDYKKYHNALLEQKQRQQKQLVHILDYLDNLLEAQAVL